MSAENRRHGAGLGASALAFAFVGSACLLVLEIVAGRLVAPRLGVSLNTWTSVIGVVLAGVSLGNYLGGRLADRRPTRATLGLVYLAASGSSVLVRLSLGSVDESGRVVGRIQAAAALGSILGTFLTGFVLISAFGTRHVVVCIAAVLLALAVIA